MGILDRILAGMAGHGSSHGHGNSRGHGSPSSHDWGHNPAPSVSGITLPRNAKRSIRTALAFAASAGHRWCQRRARSAVASFRSARNSVLSAATR
jgi:hypothetical protein